MPPPVPAEPGLLVLVVSADSRRGRDVAQAVAGWPVAARVSSVAGAMAAVRAVLARTPELAVVDQALEAVGGPALAQQLARLRPGLPVLNFGTAAGGGADASTRAWPWSELEVVLDRWLDLRLERR